MLGEVVSINKGVYVLNCKGNFVTDGYAFLKKGVGMCSLGAQRL